MFNFILVLLISGEAPDPVAAFKAEAACQYLAGVINKADIRGKAVCVPAVLHGNI